MLRHLATLLAAVAVLTACSVGPLPAPATKLPSPTPTATRRPARTPTPRIPPATPRPGPTPEGVQHVLTLHLRRGVKWSDGSGDLTARDVLGTYNILWANRDASWDYLKDVRARDDYTVEFYIGTPSPRILRLILRSNQAAPYSQYGPWMDQAAELRASRADRDGKQVKKFIKALQDFEPDDVVTYGPFKLAPESVTETRLELVKNPGGLNADKINMERVIVYYGEAADSVPLILAGEIDYSPLGYTPVDLAAFEARPNIELVRSPTGAGLGLWFNQAVYPLNKKPVRQAFAYIIDRQENARVAVGDAGQAVKYMAGFTDLQVPMWLSERIIARLNPYDKDWEKAEELLAGAGCRKGADGVWLDDRGNRMAFELSAPADLADWLGSAENAARQLNAFGIEAGVRGYLSPERSATQKEGRYQILVDQGLYYSPPHPHTSFNYYLNAPRNNPEAKNALVGYNWSWNQTRPGGQAVYVPNLLRGASAGFDPERQRPYIETLALLVNEELPVLALFEHYAADPVACGLRVAGWLPFDDEIYKNAQADSPIAIQFLDGTLQPVDGSDKSFRTVHPYPQPPDYTLNYWNPYHSLPQNVGLLAYHLLYPPFAFYMWAAGEYAPMAAEGFELR